ncbi:DUF3558 domain-containing protein [Amycolatopsis sp. NPDC059657]|uniref:DUF3558 domain-containing protein n=1 Tax=Amycolatopsis sp. NPDC059657 TaxID=3346899 RepID=UPI003670A319
MRTLAQGLVMVAVGLTLASCSPKTPGSASTAPSVPSSRTNGAAVDVPQVEAPLEVTRFEQDPCAVLSQDQASQLANLTTTDKGPGATDLPICGWRDGSRNTISFGFVRGNGLRDPYQNHAPGDPGYFEVAPAIAGYPAVFSDISDGRADGSCTLIVGVRNDEVLTVMSTLPRSSPHLKNACQLVQKAAEAAIATIKGAK